MFDPTVSNLNHNFANLKLIFIDKVLVVLLVFLFFKIEKVPKKVLIWHRYQNYSTLTSTGIESFVHMV